MAGAARWSVRKKDALLLLSATFAGGFYAGHHHAAAHAPAASAPPPRSPWEERGPPTKAELGQAGWTLLHTLAANYPEPPTPEERAGEAASQRGTVATEEWVQRAPNQIRITGTGRKPRAARLRDALEPIASSILGVGTSSHPQGWQGYVTLANPQECTSIIQRHGQAAILIGGQPVELELVPWHQRSLETREASAEGGGTT